MASKNTVEIKLTLKDQISRAYSKVRKSVTDNNKKTRDSLKTVEQQAKKTQIGLKGVIGAAAGFIVFRQANMLISESIRLAGEQQAAEAKVAAAIKSTGGVAGVTTHELKKMASELQSVTTVGDETILRGQALLLTFKKIGKDVFPQATEAMLNVAQAMGTDVKESAIQLGKALNDPITGLTSLRRVGITFSEEQEKTIKNFAETNRMVEAQTLILEELESQFGGMARAMAKTDSGKLEQLDNLMGDLKEKIGAAILPDMIEMSKEFVTWLKIAQESGVISRIFAGIADSLKLSVASVKQFNLGLEIALGADKMDKLAFRAEKAFKALTDFEAAGMPKSHKAQLAYKKKYRELADAAAAALRAEGDAQRRLNALRDTDSPLGQAYDNTRNRYETIDQQKMQRELDQRAAERLAARTAGIPDDAAKVPGPTQDELDKQAALMEKARQKELAAAKAHSAQLLAIKKAETNARWAMAGQLVQIGDMLAKSGKGNAEAAKVFAIAEVAINTSRAIMATLAVGGAFAMPQAILMGITGAIQANNIRAQAFENGGILEGGPTSGDKTMFRGNAGEMIINKAQQRNLLSIANGGGEGSRITFEAPIINIANGDPATVQMAVEDTYQEMLQKFADTQRDAEVNQIL